MAPTEQEPADETVGGPEGSAAAQPDDVEAADVGDDAHDARDAHDDGAEVGPEVEADPRSPLEIERDQFLDALRRERADFENFRKRAERERMEALDRGREHVVAELLGVLDNFGHVLKGAERSEDAQLSKGVEMVHGELVRALEDVGLERVPGEGAPFDPAHHEALEQRPAEEPLEEPVVVKEHRPGYRFKGRVLRPATVTVAQ
ncbi:MAG: nucleotide exchange factor GrpE [Actinomycetota bacterium]